MFYSVSAKDAVLGIVVGCKADQTDLRQVTKEEAVELAVRYNARYFEVSSKSGERIPEMFDGLATSMLSKHLGWQQDPRLRPKLISTRSVRDRVSTINSATTRRTNSRASSFIMARSRSLRNSFRLRHRSASAKKRAAASNSASATTSAASSELVLSSPNSPDVIQTVSIQEEKRETKWKAKLLCCTAPPVIDP